jgi:hypothetical protein
MYFQLSGEKGSLSLVLFFFLFHILITIYFFEPLISSNFVILCNFYLEQEDPVRSHVAYLP